MVRVRAEMAREVKSVLSQRLWAEGMVTFGDTLVEARDSLNEVRIGAGASDLLRRRYSIALVDEAQDTDPIQWQILRSVFDESRLVVIGDPKQSIYAFRGADIESYLSAVEDPTTHRTLVTNWRSDGPLIAALDALLAGATFGDDRIGYRPVLPAERNRKARISGAGSALEIRRFSGDFLLPRQQYKPFFYVGEARGAVAADVAAEVVRLLDDGVTLTGSDGGARPLGPGDIAVLCRTGRQVGMIRDALTAAGVPSVVARTGSVFATPAAEHWRRFLLAVERPSRAGYLRLAATTPLVGKPLREVAGLSDDSLLDLQQRFLRWQGLLHDHGVPAMFADVDRTTGLTARVLARSDGERELTDLNHIAEEMHAAWRRGRIGSLVVWIEVAMDEAARNAEANVEDAESRQRRLDTDAAAVQVLTVHAAKGLEYPVVMAPFLWDIPRITPRIPIFHDPEPAPEGAPRRRLIDVGGPASPGFESHQQAAMDEETAEEGRLLYVALTRAKHRLVVWWIENTANSARTKLHQILSRGRDPDRTIERLVEASGERSARPSSAKRKHRSSTQGRGRRGAGSNGPASIGRSTTSGGGSPSRRCRPTIPGRGGRHHRRTGPGRRGRVRRPAGRGRRRVADGRASTRGPVRVAGTRGPPVRALRRSRPPCCDRIRAGPRHPPRILGLRERCLRKWNSGGDADTARASRRRSRPVRSRPEADPQGVGLRTAAPYFRIDHLAARCRRGRVRASRQRRSPPGLLLAAERPGASSVPRLPDRGHRPHHRPAGPYRQPLYGHGLQVQHASRRRRATGGDRLRTGPAGHRHASRQLRAPGPAVPGGPPPVPRVAPPGATIRPSISAGPCTCSSGA